jgi:hypothetical protein
MKVSFRQNLLPGEGAAVKRKRFSVEPIVAVLKQAEVGVPVAELGDQRADAVSMEEAV